MEKKKDKMQNILNDIKWITCFCKAKHMLEGMAMFQ